MLSSWRATFSHRDKILGNQMVWGWALVQSMGNDHHHHNNHYLWKNHKNIYFCCRHAPQLIHSNSSPPFVLTDSLKEAVVSDKASWQKSNGSGSPPFISFQPSFSNLKNRLNGQKMFSPSNEGSIFTIKVTRNLKTSNGLCNKRTMGGNNDQIQRWAEMNEQTGKCSRVFPAIA